jgi:hypothetical protein
MLIAPAAVAAAVVCSVAALTPDEVDAAAAHHSIRPVWQAADSAEEQPHVPCHQLLSPPVQHGTTWLSLLHTPREQQPQQHSSPQQPHSPRQQQQQQSPRQRKQLHAHYQQPQQELDELGFGQEPGSSCAGSKRCSEDEQEDSLPG